MTNVIEDFEGLLATAASGGPILVDKLTKGPSGEVAVGSEQLIGIGREFERDITIRVPELYVDVDAKVSLAVACREDGGAKALLVRLTVAWSSRASDSYGHATGALCDIALPSNWREQAADLAKPGEADDELMDRLFREELVWASTHTWPQSIPGARQTPGVLQAEQAHHDAFLMAAWVSQPGLLGMLAKPRLGGGFKGWRNFERLSQLLAWVREQPEVTGTAG
jgi:hypothetical protein